MQMMMMRTMKQGTKIDCKITSPNIIIFRIPSYDEIVNQNDEDDEEFDKAEEFERKYNFRYQEPDSEFVCLFNIIYIFQ